MADLTLYQPFSFDRWANWDWKLSGGTAGGLTYNNAAQQSITLAGNFNVTTDGQVSGTISQVSFLQGSVLVFKATGLSLDAGTLANLIDNGLDANAAMAYLLGGSDTIKGSSGSDELVSYGGKDFIQAGAGPDLIVGGPGDDVIDGGSGRDIVWYSGNIADYKIERIAGGVTVTDLKGDGGTDQLYNIERVDFGNKAFLPVDVNGASGQIVRMYQAAFDRMPDAFGMNYWEGQMEQGVPLAAVAGAFVNSAEFKALYGTGLTNTELVGKFYQHVLHRTGEKAGIDFWAGVLDSHAATTAQVLAAISESPENVQQSVTLIGTGLVVDLPLIIAI